MTSATLEALYVGTPRELTDANGKPWTSSIARRPVAGPLVLGPDGLPDDRPNYPSHGGPDRAVLAYGAATYERWAEELGGAELRRPGFGENFLIAGQDEATVCIGDVFQVGGARVQVTMPRNPCANLPRYNAVEDLLTRVIATGRTGWLLRVLVAGPVAVGDRVELIERPSPEWTVARVFQADRALRARKPDAIEDNRAIAALPALAAAWREGLEKRLP